MRKWKNTKEKGRLGKNVEQMNRQVEVIREPKTRSRLTDQILKSYPHLRCYDFDFIHLRYFQSFSAFAK